MEKTEGWVSGRGETDETKGQNDKNESREQVMQNRAQWKPPQHHKHVSLCT